MVYITSILSHSDFPFILTHTIHMTTHSPSLPSPPPFCRASVTSAVGVLPLALQYGFGHVES